MSGSPDWTVVGLLGSWSGGSTPSKEVAAFWHDGTVPWVTPKDMGAAAIASSEDFITEAGAAQLTEYRAGDVAVVFRSGVLRHRVPVARGLCRFTVNQDVKVLHPSPDVDSGYAFHVVRGVERVALIRAVKVGTTVESIDGDVFFKLPVFCPRPHEQRAIAAVLDSLDDSIQTTEQIIAKLQQVKQGLLHDLLTRGINENGELRDPERHPEQFQDSPLGRIPRAWRCERLGDLTTKIVDGVHHTPDYVTAGVPFLTVENLTEGVGISLEPCRFVTTRAHAEYVRRADPRPGDVLVSKDGTLGVARLVPPSFPDVSIFVSVALLRPRVERIRAELIVEFFETPWFVKQLARRSAGTGLKHIHLEHFREFVLPVPPRAEQSAIVDRLGLVLNRLAVERDLARTMHFLKIGVSEDLLTGRVRTTALTEAAA